MMQSLSTRAPVKDVEHVIEHCRVLVEQLEQLVELTFKYELTGLGSWLDEHDCHALKGLLSNLQADGALEQFLIQPGLVKIQLGFTTAYLEWAAGKWILRTPWDVIATINVHIKEPSKECTQ